MMSQVDLDVEIRKRKEKILTLKAEVDALTAAKAVLDGQDITPQKAQETKTDNQEDE